MFDSFHSYTMKLKKTKEELEAQRSYLLADLYQRAARAGVHSVEELCRKLHCIEIKILFHSYKGGIYGK